MYSTKVEKQDKVLKPYFLSVTLVAILSTEVTKTLLPYWFSSVLCFVIYRTQVIKNHNSFYLIIPLKLLSLVIVKSIILIPEFIFSTTCFERNQ